MGGVLSTKGFKEVMQTDELQETPARKIHRIIDPHLDPRSPTVGLSRTPIAVSATPYASDGTCTPVLKTKASKQLNNEPDVMQLDPRSPSDGITRTPLLLKESLLDSLELKDPRSPTCGIDRTPIVIEQDKGNTLPDTRLGDSVPNIDAIPPIANLDLELELINRSLSEPDLSKDDTKLINPKNGDRALFKESTPKKKATKIVMQGFSHDDLTSKSFKLKEQSISRKCDKPRSPLSLRNNVDINSPRNIVQRKQATKLSMSMKGTKLNYGSPKNCTPRSPSRFQALDATDKENMF